MRGSVCICRRTVAGAVLAAVLALSGIAKAGAINVPPSGERTGVPGQWLAPPVIGEFSTGLAGPQAESKAGGFSGLPYASRAEDPAQAESPPDHDGAASLVPSSAAPEPGTMLLVGVALLLGARIAGRFAPRR